MLGEELQPRLLRTPSSWWFSWVSFYRESGALPHHLHVIHAAGPGPCPQRSALGGRCIASPLRAAETEGRWGVSLKTLPPLPWPHGPAADEEGQLAKQHQGRAPNQLSPRRLCVDL